MMYLLVLTIYTFDGASVTTHELNNLEECRAIGEEWTRTSRKFSYICAPIQKDK